MFDIEIVQELEEKATKDTIYSKKLKEVYDLLKDQGYLYDKKYQDAYNLYNELVIKEFIQGKCAVDIEMIEELKGVKTPDYKIIFDDKYYTYSVVSG